MSANYPDLTLEQMTAVCHTPFKFLREQIEGDKLVEVRLKYFGTFQVFPGRAKNYLFNLKRKSINNEVNTPDYERVSSMIEKYLKTIEE